MDIREFPEVEDETIITSLPAITAMLEAIAGDMKVLGTLSEEERRRFHLAVAQIYDPEPSARRQKLKAEERARKSRQIERAEAALNEAGIRALRRKPVYSTPNIFLPDNFDEIQKELQELDELQHCYVCKAKFSTLHHFYDQMCTACADFNFLKRTERADLRGRVAILTGGRVKIGYQAAIKLLRCGASVIVTTRFPRDASQRYSQEADFGEWGHRLQLYGLDLRHTPSVEAFCQEMLATLPRLDFIVNNACQTVRRPPQFYKHMMDRERDATAAQISSGTQELPAVLAPALSPALSAELSQLPLLPEDLLVQNHLFPEGWRDQDLQQIDLRERNSWRLLMSEVSTVELLEVQLINAISPFVINARLKPLMMRSPERDKHIVNVSAVEGQFYRLNKTTRHPHTNMAKAALNMMTRTAAADYQSDGIHMNSVDTGWVTDEDAAEIAARKVAEQRFHPPLDIVDGAARIVDPIITGFNTGEHIWGQFLKDYRPTTW